MLQLCVCVCVCVMGGGGGGGGGGWDGMCLSEGSKEGLDAAVAKVEGRQSETVLQDDDDVLPAKGWRVLPDRPDL